MVWDSFYLKLKIMKIQRINVNKNRKIIIKTDNGIETFLIKDRGEKQRKLTKIK